MSAEDLYKITIKGNGLDFDREVTKEVGDKILVMIISNGTASGDNDASKDTAQPYKHTGASASPSPLGSITKSIREYLDEHQAKTNIHYITAMGEYLKIYDKKQDFTSVDLLKCFKDASEPTPANISRDIGKTKKGGFIANNKMKKGAFYVTKSGIDAVNSNFNNTPRKPRRVKRTKVTKGKDKA